jgi:hypothetical protein
MEIALQDLSIALAKNESRNECLVFENVLYCTLLRIDSDRSSWFSAASYPMFSLIVILNTITIFGLTINFGLIVIVGLIATVSLIAMVRLIY